MPRPTIDPNDEFAARRAKMVEQQVLDRGVSDPAVLRAMSIVPRERFVTPRQQYLAYEDTPLPIPGRQTISQPYVVALMLSSLRLQPDDRVLEVGTGSGYAAALLSRIVREVHTVERLEELVAYARERMKELHYDNVYVHHGDGTLGWPANAPYGAIVVAAGGPEVPASLRQQLALNGRLVMPVCSSERRQHLIMITRISVQEYEQADLGAVAFVPLIGREGW